MKFVLSILIFVCFSLFIAGCGSVSLPTLEASECLESRDTVKQFYSLHFGNEMKFSQENLKLREKLLTPEFVKLLENEKTENDVFTTNSTDMPRAFRLGGCRVIEPTKTNVEILIFWRDEKATRQESIRAEVIKQQDKWLINKVLR